MKKILILLLSLLLVFSLAACDNNETPNNDDPLNRDPGTSQNGDQGNSNNSDVNIDFGAIIAGNGDTSTVWGKQDDATKQAIIDEGKASGYDITFGDDGSMNVKDEDGNEYIQKPDGTWTMKFEDGGEAQFGGNWPENEFTKLVPKPSFTLMGANSDEYSFNVGFTNVTVEQIKAYVEELKGAGFTQGERTDEQEVMGMVIYRFTASHPSGYTVNINYASGSSGMSIEK